MIREQKKYMCAAPLKTNDVNRRLRLLHSFNINKTKEIKTLHTENVTCLPSSKELVGRKINTHETVIRPIITYAADTIQIHKDSEAKI